MSKIGGKILIVFSTLSKLLLNFYVSQVKIWQALESDPIFRHVDDLPLDAQRELATKRMYRVRAMNFLPLEDILEDPRLVSIFLLWYHYLAFHSLDIKSSLWNHIIWIVQL